MLTSLAQRTYRFIAAILALAVLVLLSLAAYRYYMIRLGYDQRAEKPAEQIAPVAFSQTDNTVDDEQLMAEPKRIAATSPPLSEAEAQPLNDGFDVVGFEQVFDSQPVFISVSEPQYLITRDNQRIDTGQAIDDDTTLIGITDDQLILERSGRSVMISLSSEYNE